MTETKNRFLEMRAKGFSLARIARELGVSKRTLVTWNQSHAEEVRAMRAIELEALQEKLLASEKNELTWLSAMLQKIEDLLLDRELRHSHTMDLWRMQSQLRAEIRQRRILCDYDFTKSAIKESESESTPKKSDTVETDHPTAPGDRDPAPVMPSTEPLPERVEPDGNQNCTVSAPVEDR